MRTLSLISDSATPCGVEQFQRRLAARLDMGAKGSHASCAIVGQPGEIAVLDRALATSDAVVVGLPVVAWKRRLAAPMRAMALARRRGKAVILVLHEWADLDWKRRALYRAYVPFATRLMFSSPVVRAQFAVDPISAVACRTRDLMPIPPNLEPPTAGLTTPVSEAITALRQSGKLVIGTFGSIYPRKQPGAVLDVVAALKALGQPAHAVFVGDFVRDATVDVQALFDREVARLDLTEDATVTGFMTDPEAVFAALSACDVLTYRFDEGLTSRRASVFAALLSGRPVVVNAPADAREFDHHPAYGVALQTGALTLVPTDATTDMFARVVRASKVTKGANLRCLFDRAWTSAADAVEGNEAPIAHGDVARVS